jgi:hypothetical protein
MFALLLAVAPQAMAQKQPDADKAEADAAKQRAATKEDFVLERRANVEASVVLSVCVETGDMVVRGWDRNEVRARADDAGSLRLLTPNVQPASRVEVLVDEDRDAELESGDCGSTTRLELMVPRGATVILQVQSGHVEVADVAEARVKALSGDVNVRRVAKGVEVSCLSGDVSLSDSSGGARLITMSGSIEARNLRTITRGDDFQAKTQSGDVTLEGVAHAQVSGSTISGNVLYEGGLARGGVYDLRTTSGDVAMELPADSSFVVHAKVVISGDIITDFPVKTVASASASSSASASASSSSKPTDAPDAPDAPTVVSPAPPDSHKPGKHKPPKPPKPSKSPTETRLDGTVGTGDAVLTLSSFSGSVHLRKR